MLAFFPAEVLWVPAGMVIVEKALVQHNYAYRCYSNVVGADVVKSLQHASSIFPKLPGEI